MNSPEKTLPQSLAAIEEDIASLTAQDVYDRDTWIPIRKRLTALVGSTPDDYSSRLLHRAGFQCWEVRDTRGPKHKDQVRQRLLKTIRELRDYIAPAGTPTI